jgi:putative sterol carrier protein
MSDAAVAFFEGLGSQGHVPLLERAKGKIRVDLAEGRQIDHWLVSIDRGAVAVSREKAEADAVLRTDRATFDGVVSGRINTLAASLRGVLTVEGDPELVVLFRRVFPGPPDSRGAPGLAVKGVAS